MYEQIAFRTGSIVQTLIVKLKVKSEALVGASGQVHVLLLWYSNIRLYIYLTNEYTAYLFLLRSVRLL